MNEISSEPQDVMRVLSRMCPAGLEMTLCDLMHRIEDALDLSPKRPDGIVRQFRLDELAPLAATICFLFDCISDELPRVAREGGAR